MKIIPPLRNSESKASGNKCSSKDVRWRSFLRWGTVKVKLLETNAPQKILMIRFETKTWLMENQVKLSCFSPVSVHLEIWLQLFWNLLDQNQSRFHSRDTCEAAAEAGRVYNYTKRAFTDKTLRTINQTTEDMRRLCAAGLTVKFWSCWSFRSSDFIGLKCCSTKECYILYLLHFIYVFIIDKNSFSVRYIKNNIFFIIIFSIWQQKDT